MDPAFVHVILIDLSVVLWQVRLWDGYLYGSGGNDIWDDNDDGNNGKDIGDYDDYNNYDDNNDKIIMMMTTWSRLTYDNEGRNLAPNS